MASFVLKQLLPGLNFVCSTFGFHKISAKRKFLSRFVDRLLYFFFLFLLMLSISKILFKFIFPFLRSGVEAKCVQNSAESGERSVLTLGFLCFPSCVRDTLFFFIFISRKR